ncbi:MAG: BCCT family transporter [Aestuariibacter sp.]
MQPQSNSSSLNPNVFITSSCLIVLLLLFSLFAPELAADIFEAVQNSIIDNGSWFYVLTVAIILLLVVFLGLSRYGEIRLGPDHAKPEFSYATWLPMLFAAGMGIGLMFFGVAEPLMHYLAPPTAEPQSIDAAREAMKTTFFHWGLHAWAIYAVVALILAYFSFRHRLPLTLRSALYPLIGERIYGWPGDVVDTFAVISTIFGVATSLGLGASQVNSGLDFLFGFAVSNSNQIILMIAIVAIAVVSVATGLEKGIRRLSELNMIMAIALLIFILALGPTVFLLKAYLQNTGAYLSDLVRNTFNLYTYAKTEWIGGWTIFYWGWWLAWAPFVGLFIARISKGRTINEFVFGVMIVPAAFTLLWMTVFGSSAIDIVATEPSNLGSLAKENSSVALFVFLQHFPFSDVLSAIAILMVVVFFVTSCDSGAMVVDMLCSHGNNNTPLWQRIYWAVGIGIVASILLLAGGLSALQTMTIASALPFAIIILIACYGLMRALRVDLCKRDSLNFSTSPATLANNKDAWRERLETIVDFPSKAVVQKFIQKDVLAAFKQLEEEFSKHDIDVHIETGEESIALKIEHGDEYPFIYGVHRRRYVQPDYASPESETEDETAYYRAEVHLREGGQDYDIMGWSKLAIINDVIDQYHKHQHFLHLLR